MCYVNLKHRIILKLIFVICITFLFQGCFQKEPVQIQNQNEELANINNKTYVIKNKTEIQNIIKETRIMENAVVSTDAPAFLSETQKEIFNKVVNINEELFFKDLDLDKTDFIEKNGNIYIKTNILLGQDNYNDFINYISTYLTTEYIERCINPYIIEHKNAIYSNIEKKEINNLYKSHEFIIKSKQNTNIQFNNNVEYYTNELSEQTIQKILSYKMVLNEGKWKISDFELWY